MKIVVHSKTGCPSCVRAKKWLDDRELEYELLIYDDYTERNKMYDEFGLVGNKRTVPQIVVDGVRIGGADDLEKSDVADRASAGNFNMDF